MACYFFDSSALIKRYVSETGTAWIDSLLDPAAENETYLARIAGVEVVSAIKRRERGGTTSANDAQSALSNFRADFGLFLVVEINATLISLTELRPLFRRRL